MPKSHRPRKPAQMTGPKLNIPVTQAMMDDLEQAVAWENARQDRYAWPLTKSVLVRRIVAEYLRGLPALQPAGATDRAPDPERDP